MHNELVARNAIRRSGIRRFVILLIAFQPIQERPEGEVADKAPDHETSHHVVDVARSVPHPRRANEEGEHHRYDLHERDQERTLAVDLCEEERDEHAGRHRQRRVRGGERRKLIQ